jgi:hypothetical protein
MAERNERVNENDKKWANFASRQRLAVLKMPR